MKRRVRVGQLRADKGGHFTADSPYYQYYSLLPSGKYGLYEVIDDALFDIDGHPSFTADHRYMITDSYPDDKQYQRLIVYDLVTHKGILIAQFYAFYHKTPASCDLHPKLCRNNDYIVVDSAYNEYHHMIILKLDWTQIKQQISNQ